MKKLLFFIFLTVALALGAGNYQIMFDACMSDGNFEAADSLIKEWSRKAPDDPELFPARFNLLLNRAHSDMLVLSDKPAHGGEQLQLADSTGNSMAYLYSEVSWQDSLLDMAFVEIDRGISACPDRIDFRLGKAAAATMSARWETAVDALDGLLEHDAKNSGKWLGSGNAGQSGADTLLADAVFDRLSDIYRSDSRGAVEAALPLVAKAAKRFPADVRILNLAGGMNYGIGSDGTALAYFEEAARVAPDDALPLTNIGYILYQRGDSAGAIEIYRKIENGKYDDDSKNIARQMIAEITTPIQNMEEYFYFFRYLPQIAAQATSSADFLDVEMINSRIPAYNKLRSPFADSDIAAEEVLARDGGSNVVVWTFPMPSQMPMCRYMAFVPDGNGHCKVLTLEKSLEDYWIVGTMTNDVHSNFSGMPYPADAAAFVEGLRLRELVK